MGDEIDQEARDMAQSALAKLQGHEDVCGVRYAALDATLKEIKSGMRSQAVMALSAQSFVIVTLMGIVAWLAMKVF